MSEKKVLKKKKVGGNVVEQNLEEMPTAKIEDTVKEEVKERETPTVNNVVNFPEVEETETFHMPCGYVTEDGERISSFTVREMTGEDEEAIGGNEMKKNPTKAVNALLTRCTTSIGNMTKKTEGAERWREIIKSLYVGDADYIMIKIRQVSHGDEISFTSECPHCKTVLKTEISVNELPFVEFKGETIIPFELPKGYVDKKGVKHIEGTMRIPNGVDREILMSLAQKNLPKANTALLTRVCKFNDKFPVDESVMRGLKVGDREYLNNLLGDSNFGYKFTADLECPECEEVSNVTLNAQNFI